MINPVEISAASAYRTRSATNGSASVRWDARTTVLRRTASLWIVPKNPKSDIPNHGSAPHMPNSICGVFLYSNICTYHRSRSSSRNSMGLEITFRISNIECSIILSKSKGKSSIFEIIRDTRATPRTIYRWSWGRKFT